MDGRYNVCKSLATIKQNLMCACERDRDANFCESSLTATMLIRCSTHKTHIVAITLYVCLDVYNEFVMCFDRPSFMLASLSSMLGCVACVKVFENAMRRALVPNVCGDWFITVQN